MEPQETQFSGADAAAAAPASGSAAGYGSTHQDRNIANNNGIITNSNGNTTTPNGNTTVNGNSTAKGKLATARAVGPDLLRGLLMLFMAMDHTVVSVNSWPHGQGRETEADGTPIVQWNRTIGYAVRTMSHLCAPGFFLLLGMGVAYFGRSRSRLGWSAGRMGRHFVVRGAVLTALTVAMGLMIGLGKVWFLNVVLFALGWDYMMIGGLWLGVSWSEPRLASVLGKFAGGGGGGGGGSEENGDVEQDGDEDAVRRPLLSSPLSTQTSKDAITTTGARVSYHIHNILLLALVLVTIWWNIWLSPNGGRCISTNADDIFALANSNSNSNSNNNNNNNTSSEPDIPITVGTSLFDFFFRIYVTPHIISVFPPMGWLSFGIAGLLYARLVLHPRATASRIRIGTLLASAALFVLFICTRVFRFGNTSEDCFHTPDQQHVPVGGNQYLASPQAFFYLSKYPPDVAFFAYTLGVNFLFLVVLDMVPRRFLPASNANVNTASSFTLSTIPSKLFTAILSILLTFGNSALFFYMIHQILVFSAGSVLVAFLGEELPGQTNPLHPEEPLRGVQSVWAFWGLWTFVVVVMYPLCRWYARFKSSKGVDSVWRFF